MALMLLIWCLQLEYEDEYDDSYDDLGGGVADGSADVEGDAEASASRQPAPSQAQEGQGMLRVWIISASLTYTI